MSGHQVTLIVTNKSDHEKDNPNLFAFEQVETMWQSIKVAKTNKNNIVVGGNRCRLCNQEMTVSQRCVFLPCRHTCVCTNCWSREGPRISKCMMCQTPIQGMIVSMK